MSFGQKPFRFEPQGPASAYQTFQIKTPRGPEVERPATCEEVDCDAWRYGWVTRVPATDNFLDMIRGSKRTWTAVDQVGGEWVFTFAPGTACFQAGLHHKPVRPDLPQLFLARDGDWRGNPRGTQPRIHTRPEDWVEHAQEVTAQVVDRSERG